MVKVKPTASQGRITVRSNNDTTIFGIKDNLSEYYAKLSERWANSPDMVNGIDYSSKHYAEESKEYCEDAKEARDIAVTTIEGLDDATQEAITYIEQARSNAVIGITNMTADITTAIQENVEANCKSLPMFSPIWSDHILNDASYLRADTFSWHNGDIYTTAYNLLLNEFNSDKSIEELEGNVTYKRTPSGFKIADLTQHENVLTTFTMTGKSWFYVIDTEEQRFKLPRTQYGFTGIRDNVGGNVEAGLPTLTTNSTGAHGHNIYQWNQNNQNYNATQWNTAGTAGTVAQTGAYHPASQLTWSSTAFKSAGGNNSFDGSGDISGTTNLTGAHSHTIAGNSDTVQTPATQMYLYFFVGNYVRPQSDIDIGELVEVVNNRDFEEQIAQGKNELNTTKNNCIKEINSTSVGDRVLKTGDTMTGALHIQGQLGMPIQFTNMDVTDGTTPATSNMYYGIQFNDAKGNRIGKLEGGWYTDGTTSFGLSANRIIDGANKYCSVTCKVDAQGNQITSAPTPPTGDNSTKIATTAWVNNNKSTIASWSSPDWSKKESKILNTTYTANKNGFILFTSQSSGSAVGNASLKINGVEVIYDYHGSDNDDCHCYAPVAKNDTYNITCTHSAKYYYFVPYKEV